MPVQAEARGAEIVKFKPVKVGPRDDVAVALGKLAKGMNDLHECVHSGHEAQATRDLLADQKREALAGQVGAIQARQEIDGGRITALAKAIGTEAVEKGEPKPRAKVGMGWKEHLKIAGTVGACLGLFVFLYRMAVALAPAFHEFMLKVQT